MNSEDQLSAVGRQPTRIIQVPGNALPALLYLYRSQPCLGKAQFLSPRGAIHLFGEHIVKYHILTNKSTNSKCPSQIFPKGILPFLEHPAQIRQHYHHSSDSSGLLQSLSPVRNAPDFWRCRLEQVCLFLYMMQTRSGPVPSWLSGFSCQWCACEIHPGSCGCSLFILTAG